MKPAGREFYAQNINCDFGAASPWVEEHVSPLLTAFDLETLDPDLIISGSDEVWLPPSSIRDALLDFLGDDIPEFWGYQAGYDHVALAQLFGRMINLPAGWPKYTRDIKQWSDELGKPSLPEHGLDVHNALADARWTRDCYLYLRDFASQIQVVGPASRGLQASPSQPSLT
jgi:hypothetical protein